jgi:hypothetical protein
MNAVSSRWRRWAMRLAQHAAGVMPGARSPWAEAMRRELDYIEHGSTALRWALGCVLASYRLRLAERPFWSARCTWRHVAASGGLMLLIGLTLQVSAEGQTDPPRPGLDATTCDRPDGDRPNIDRPNIDRPGVSPQVAPNGSVSVRRGRGDTNAERVRCADRDLPNRPERDR